MQISAVSYCWESSWCNRAGPSTGKPEEMLISAGNRNLMCCSPAAVRMEEVGTKAGYENQASFERVSPPSFQEEIVSFDPTSAPCDETFSVPEDRHTKDILTSRHEPWWSQATRPYLHIKQKILIHVSFKMNTKRSQKGLLSLQAGENGKVEGDLPGNLHFSPLESNLTGLIYSHYSGEMPFGSKVCLHRACLFLERVPIHCVLMAHPYNQWHVVFQNFSFSCSKEWNNMGCLDCKR